MGRPRNRPAEFPTDWHWERYHEDLERELAGRKARLQWLKTQTDAEPGSVEQAEGEIEAVEAQLEHYGWGQKAASKRPAGAQKKTRAKK